MKTAWIKSFLSVGAKVLPCTALLTVALAATVQAQGVLPDPVYTWDGADGTATGEKIYGKTVYSVTDKVFDADSGISGGVPAKNFTFSMWTKKSSSPNWRDVCGFSDSTHQFKLEENTNGGLYVYGSAHGLNTDSDPKFIPAADFSSSALQLLTVVQENGIVKGYINGALKMTTLESTAWANLKSDTATMKWFAWGCSPSTSGGVDRNLTISAADVRIYNVALTAEQVAAQYAAYEESITLETATLSTDVAFSSLNITGGENTNVVLTAENDVTLTMDEALVTYRLTLNGPGKITFVGANKLEADLTVNTNADIAAIPARLGAIEVAAEKTLMVDLNTRWKSVSGEGTIVEPERDSISFRVDSAYGSDTFSSGTTYGWLSARADGSVWNALADSVSNPKNKDGIQLTTTSVTVTAKGGGWSHTAPAQLGGGSRGYFDGQWNLTLSGVPYSKYAVVLYMATDNTGKQWGPVKVTRGSTETFYSYDANKELISGEGVTASSNWGVTATANGGEGVDVMVIPDLSDEVSLLTHGTSGTGDAVRGGLFAMQIINTGTSSIESKFFTASSEAAEVSLSDLTWNEAPLEPTSFDTATVTLVDGATFTIDGALPLAKLKLVCNGSITINAVTASLENITMIDATGVSGMVTYNANDWYSRIPFGKMVGVDKIRKTYTGDWTPGDVSMLEGYQLEITAGSMLVNSAMQTVIATAEHPILVTGASSVLMFDANQNYNRMPNNGYIKATNGGTVTLKGVNLFNGDNAPHILLDGGILKTTATAGGHIKINSVSMANGSKIQLSRVENAYQSEGLYIRTGDDSKLTVTAGDNVVEYLEDGSNNNALKIDGGVIEVASGASLEVKVPVVTDSGTVTKTGEGRLTWNGSTANGIAVSAGEFVFNANAVPTNTFSGAGTIVADGATLDLTNATLADTLTLTMRNQGVLLLNKAQVKAMQVPAGTTLKVKVTDYTAQTLQNVTLADETAAVYFVLPSGMEVKGTVSGSDITMAEQSVYTYTATAGEENLWSTAAKWKYNGAAVETAPDGTITTPVEVVLTGATTLTMDVAEVTLSALSVSGGDLTIDGAQPLTVGLITTTNKVVVSGALILDVQGTEAAPTEITNVFEVAEGGTLTTKGYLNLPAENQLHTGTLTVSGGKTQWKGEAGGWSAGMTGTITVESGASLALAGSDIIHWDSGDSAPLTINVKGELDVGTTRLGLNKKTLNVYGGATVKGEGDGNGAFDFHVGTNIINVIANGSATAATWEAKIKLRDAAGAPVFTVGEGASLSVTSQIWGSGAVTASGAGTLKLTGTGNTYSGGTMVDAGATLEVNTIDNLPETGAIEVNGRLRLANAGDVNHSESARYMISTTTGEGESAVTTTSPRLTGSGVLEVAGSGHYVLPAGFETPLALENNRAGGIVIAGYPGITVGSLSGSGYFRSDFTDPVGANTGDATKARTITVKQSKATTFTGYVSGNTNTADRALTLLVTKAEGVAEGVETALTISNANAARTTATKLSVASGAMVDLTGYWSQAVSGEGTVRLPTRTLVNLNLSGFTDPATTLLIPAGAEVSGYFANGTWSNVAAKIQLDGTLNLNNGASAARYTFTGPLTGSGALNLSNSPTDALRFTGDISAFTGNLSVAGSRAITFCGASTATDQKFSGKIYVHADYAYPVKVNGTWTAPVSVGAGTLTGSGSIAGTLTLASGVTLDVVDGALKVETLDALPAGCALTIKAGSVPTSAADGVVVLKAKTLPADLTDVTVTLIAAGTSAGTDFILAAGAADAEGYTPLQLQPLVEVTEYPVDVTQYPTLADAVAGGVFGQYPTDPMSLVIDFGDAPDGGEATPGTFTIDQSMGFVKVTVRGTNGGAVKVAEQVISTMDEVAVENGVNSSIASALLANTARVLVAEGATLTVEHTAAEAFTFDAATSGAGALGFKGAAAAGVMKITGSNTHSGGTVVETDTTVSLSSLAALGTGNVSGAGTVQLLSGTYINFSLAQFADADTTLAIPEGETVQGYFKNETATIAAKMLLDGSFYLTNGYSNGRYTFIGSWSGEGALRLGNTGTGSPADAFRITGDMRAFDGTIQVESVRALVFCGASTAADQKLAGKIYVHPDYAYPVEVSGTWTAIGGLQVAEGTLGGNGTIDANLTLEADAVIAASATECLKLTAGKTLSLPAVVKVSLPEGTSLAGALTILDRADTTPVDLTGKMVEVTVGDVPQPEAKLLALPSGDLAVQVPTVYEAVVPEGTSAWEALQWTIDGQAVTSKPGTLDSVVLKPAAAGAVLTSDTPLSFALLATESPVTVRFANALVTQEMYEAIPVTLTLVTTLDGLDEDVTVQLGALKYSASATVTKTALSATAKVTLPESAKIGEEDTDIIAINFKGDGEHVVSGDAAVGLNGYQVLPAQWTQVGGASGSNQAVTVVKPDGTTESIAGALDYSSKNGYNTQVASHGVLRGYLDDGGSGINVTIAVPDDWESYKAILYCATDSGNTTFTAKQVNGTWYTYSDGNLTSSATQPSAGWGDSNSRTDLTVGTNAMVIEGLTGDFTLFSNRPATPRGCVAGIQLVKVRPIYQLVPGISAKVSAATADTVVAWNELEWTDDDGNVVAAPTASASATLIIESALTLNLNGALAREIRVQGYNNPLRFLPDTLPATIPFFFSEDTVYRLMAATDVLPPTVEQLPGELRYEYAYDASANAYATLPGTVSNFTAGFNGSFTAAGGGIKFSGGAVTLSRTDGTATKTAITFTGNSQSTVASEMLFGEAEVTFSEFATVSTPKLSMADGAAGRNTLVTLEDSAQLLVTGAVNIHEGASWNQCSLKFAHWNGLAKVTLRDNAKLIAEQADLVASHSGSGSLTLQDQAEVRVKGLVHHNSNENTSTVTLEGGRLLLGETGIRSYGADDKIALTFAGGALGALRDDVTLGADADAAIATLTGAPRFASADGATLTLAQEAPFLIGDVVTNSGGSLRLKSATLRGVVVEVGTLIAAGVLEADALTLEAGAKLTFDGGVLTAATCAFGEGATLEIPVRNRLSEGGYLVMANGAALPDLSKVILSLVLDAERTDAEKVLPEVPVALGTYTDGAEPTVKGFGMVNNTNNAIADTELQLKSGDLGSGLYVVLTGTEVLKRHDVTLTDASPSGGYKLTQNAANSHPYHYFTSAVAGARLSIPADGVAISHTAFTGEPTVIATGSSVPSVVLQTNNVTVAADLTFDLSAWAEAMPDFLRGAVRGVPVSQCLISGGITMGEGVALTADFGTYTLPDGFEVQVLAGDNGLYLVATAERLAHAISVNFTDVTTPLSAPPAKVGVYPQAVASWNDLNKVYSATSLKQSDLTGIVPVRDGTPETVDTTLSVYTSKVNTLAEAPTSMLKVWLSDAQEQTLRLRKIPFDAYRVALVFASDLEAAAYAPVQIGESTYAMDGAGYTRRDVATYSVVNASSGLTTLEVLGDEAWGSTDLPEASAPIVQGYNALVSDVLTAEEVEITLPAAVYGRTYAGLAALQIVEAPVIEPPTQAQTYAYTFTQDETVALDALPLIKNGDATTPETWTSALTHTLELNSDYEVTVLLPLDFVADKVVLSGSGKFTLRVENEGGALLQTLDASALTGDLTVGFACDDVDFRAPAGTTTFEKTFNNNGQPYLIAEGATLVLGEAFASSTNMEPELFADATVDLRIDSASTGTLRRNYPVAQNRPGSDGYAWEITLAYKEATFASGNYWQPDLLVEAGDAIVVNGNNVWVTGNTTRRTFQYTQTGGSFTMGETTDNNNGFLCAPAGNSALVNGHFAISGGLLHTSAILAWDANAQVTVEVSGEGTLSLWNKLHANQAGAAIRATFTEGGTLALANTTLSKGGNGTVEVVFNGGRITTGQSEASLNFPVSFGGTETAPTELAPAAGSTLVLNAANTGSGHIAVTQGKVAVANVAALGATTSTIKAGATYEVRNATADAAMNHTVRFEEGSALSVTAAEGVTTVKVAASVQVPAELTAMVFRLNGEIYSDVTVDAAAGTVTFTTKAVAEAVKWDAAVSSGTWAEGVAEPWEDGKVYYNGAAVTFPNADSDVEVTLAGDVRPASITWETGSADTYTFTAADDTAVLTVAGDAPAMGSGQIYALPVATAARNAALVGNSNTYRLIGVLADGRTSASLIATEGNINGGDGNQGVWCVEGATLAPLPGEVQTVSAMGYAAYSNRRTAMGGSADVIIRGGGTVRFGGTMGDASNNGVGFQNKAFGGKIYIREGATLDVTMVRQRSDSRARDDYPYFALPQEANGNAQSSEPTTGVPRWTNDDVGIYVQDGGTFRVSGCRSLFGGWGNREDSALLASRPLAIGHEATAEFAYSALEQVFPHGFRFNGNGAKLLATQNMYLSGGTTLEVAGIGEEGDHTDPNTDMTLDGEGNPLNAETYGKLTAGITAEVASGAATGILPWEYNTQNSTVNEPLTLQVGEGSTLNVTANLLTLANNGTSLDRFTFKKTGAGALRFLQPLVETEVRLAVEEGTLGGTATFTHLNTDVTAASGTCVEAGLTLPALSLGAQVTLRVDVTGQEMLNVNRMTFTAGGEYTIAALQDAGAIADYEEGVPPLKVVSWGSAAMADSAVFRLDAALVEKGYGLEMRTDGLYLMKAVVYVRELTDTALSQTLDWYAAQTWYRQDDAAKTLRDYDPDENEAVTALFLLPSTFAEANATLPKVTLALSRAVSFANVRFAVKTVVDGEEVLKTLPIAVTYLYDLTQQTMPAADRAARFTWVPTLVLERDAGTSFAALQVNLPDGYEYTISNTTVMVYVAAPAPALNINFTAGGSGSVAWLPATADPCGPQPFAGVYWNNASVTAGTPVMTSEAYTVMRMQAVPAGVEATEEGVTPACEVTYASTSAETVIARLSGNADATLTGSFLSGRSDVSLPEAVCAQVGMTSAGVRGGWQVRIASVPFAAYDLYIVLAGTREDTVTYPAVRVKVGDGAWRTYSEVNGWTAPAGKNDTWQGTGGLVKGKFVDGQNVLHLRVRSTEGAALEIAPWDEGQASAEAAAAVGLAALQIVRCDDGAVMERLGDGRWSDAAGWRRTLEGGTETGAWVDATRRAPRPAVIPTVQQLDADIAAATPYLSLNGNGTMTIGGETGVLSSGAVDLSSLGAGAQIAFSEDVFANPVNVVLAPQVTLTLPEDASGTVLNRWKWITDDAGNGVDSSTAVIRKQLSGEVELLHVPSCNLRIEDGALWLAPAVNAQISGAISGAGTFGKRGSGTLTASGAITLSGMNPLRVSQGRLTLSQALTGLASGATVLVDGGTLEMANGAGITKGAQFSVMRGTLIVGGENGDAHRGRLVLVDGGSLNYRAAGAYTGYQFESLLARGENNVINLNAAGSGGAALFIPTTFVVDAGASLTVAGSSNAGIQLPGGVIEVRDGATLTTRRAIGIRYDGWNADTAANAELRKEGAGLWQIERVLSAKGDATYGQTLVVAEGEARFAFGGGAYAVEREAPIMVKAGARLSGNVSFTEKTDITFEEGAIVRNGVPGVVNSKLTFHTVTFGEGTVFEADLANTQALTISNAATFLGQNMSVRLLNLGASFAGEKRLIAWPSKPNAAFVSPEAVALDAVLEVRDDGLYLVSSNTSYVWADTDGNWSDADGWSYQGTSATYPEITSATEAATPSARVQAGLADVTLTLDASADNAVPEWKAKALVMVADAGRTATLKQGATLNATGAYDSLNALLLWNDFWKLGTGTAVVNVPVSYRYAAAEGMLNVAEGSLQLTHPLTAAVPGQGVPREQLPVAVEIVKGAVLDYALAATAEERAALNGAYDPLAQILAGEVTGAGTLRVSGAENRITLASASDNDLNLEVLAGELTLSGEIPAGAARAARRSVTVGKGAKLALTSETALGASTNLLWTLEAAEQQGALVVADGARIRGDFTVAVTDAAVPNRATLGEIHAVLDGATRFNVQEGATLALTGAWDAAEDAGAATAVTKVGKGTLELTDFMANVPVTLNAGRLVLGATAVQTMAYNEDATLPVWTVEAGAELRFGGGKFRLDKGGLTVKPGAIIYGAGAETTLEAAVTIADRSVFVFGEAGNINVGRLDFTQPTTVEGVVVVNLDALDPVTLGGTSYTLLNFNAGSNYTRVGTGSFQLGGEKLVAWAENGWTLRDTGSEVVLQHFGNGDYYTWAGDGTEGSVGEGNWANDFWVSSQTAPQLGAWPTATDALPSVMLQDVSPIDGLEIPEAARTLDWTLPEQTLASFYVNNSTDHDYTLTSSTGSSPFILSGDFLKAGSGNLTMARAVTLGADGALRLLGGETTFTGALAATSGDFKKPVTVAGEDTVLHFSGAPSRVLKGLLEGDGKGTIRQSGSGTLTIADKVDKLKQLEILERGRINLTAADQYAVQPSITLGHEATLGYAATLSGAEAVSLQVNAGAAPAGLLHWNASAPSASDKAPRLVSAVGAAAPAISVETLRYEPVMGHLILDPKAEILVPGFRLLMMASQEESTALWMGARADDDDELVVSALSGTGIIGVEPVIDLQSAPAWSTGRVLTVAATDTEIAAVEPFEGAFMGANTPEGTEILAGLAVENRTGANRTFFRYSGSSTDALLGTLSVGADAVAEVSGVWAGDVAIAAKGELMGSGTVGERYRTVSVPEDAAISGAAYGRRVLPNGTFVSEIIPATLTVKGTLALAEGAVLNTLVRKDQNGNAVASLVQTETLKLPTVLQEGAEEVMIHVNVDVEEGSVFSNVKLIGWTALDGGQKINGTVTVTINGQPQEGYLLKKKADGLYLQRRAARFWMILH